MTVFLDSSVLVAALVEDEPHHEACLPLLGRKAVVWSHALAETFATLTGGRLGQRVAPDVAAELIESSLVPRLRLVELAAADIVKALRQTNAIGIRGGAFYDYLHLVAARKSGASALYTLNARHFMALARAGDPRIEAPH